MKLWAAPLLDERALREANTLLDWRAATKLPDGRIVGRTTPGKRPAPQPVPDHRIALLNKHVPLADLRILEVGCFEGIHTLGLKAFAEDVTAIDVRVVNVAKTLLRLSLHGASAQVMVADCEEIDESFGRFDLIFHFGVLYHLMDPVRHLLRLGRFADMLYLDTHVARCSEAHHAETVEEQVFRYKLMGEGGWADPFSGADANAKHLDLPSLRRALALAGFVQQKLVQFRNERNGPRVLLLAAQRHDLSQIREIEDPDLS